MYLQTLSKYYQKCYFHDFSSFSRILGIEIDNLEWETFQEIYQPYVRYVIITDSLDSYLVMFHIITHTFVSTLSYHLHHPCVSHVRHHSLDYHPSFVDTHPNITETNNPKWGSILVNESYVRPLYLRINNGRTFLMSTCMFLSSRCSFVDTHSLFVDTSSNLKNDSLSRRYILMITILYNTILSSCRHWSINSRNE